MSRSGNAEASCMPLRAERGFGRAAERARGPDGHGRPMARSWDSRQDRETRFNQSKRPRSEWTRPISATLSKLDNMKARFPWWASPSASSADPVWDLELDAQAAERRKHERLVHLNTTVVPRLRVAGFALLSLSVLLHNRLVLGQPGWTAWAELDVRPGALLRDVLVRPAPVLRRSRSGTSISARSCWRPTWGCFRSSSTPPAAERSWLFFLPMFRVVDQTVTSFRRALAFAHLAPLSYLAVIVYIILSTAGGIPLGPEIAKVLFIYGGSLYIALIARTADERRRGMSKAIRLARQLIGDLGGSPRRSRPRRVSSSGRWKAGAPGRRERRAVRGGAARARPPDADSSTPRPTGSSSWATTAGSRRPTSAPAICWDSIRRR